MSSIEVKAISISSCVNSGCLSALKSSSLKHLKITPYRLMWVITHGVHAHAYIFFLYNKNKITTLRFRKTILLHTVFSDENAWAFISGSPWILNARDLMQKYLKMLLYKWNTLLFDSTYQNQRPLAFAWTAEDSGVVHKMFLAL